jgi:DNA-binding FadR family transcriptional regulator
VEGIIHNDLHGRVASRLGMAILRGDHPPDALLPREAELMATFGVSRTVLREALRTLTSKGLVESRPKVGTRVRSRDGWNLLDPDMLEWFARVTPQREFELKLQAMREMIEPYAARQAALAHDDATLAALDDAHRAMKAARGVDEWVRADLRFHLGLLGACRNELLVPLGALIAHTLEGHLRANAARAATFNASLAEHTEIVEAVRTRDADRAGRLMQALLAQSRARIASGPA